MNNLERYSALNKSNYLLVAIAVISVIAPFADEVIKIWDEAIYANNALELDFLENPFVLKTDGNVSLYNTKPPLVIWFQNLFLNIFGICEFAIRLPSYIASVMTTLHLYRFVKKSLANDVLSVTTVGVFITSIGYFTYHVALTGDLDAMLVLWSTLISLQVLRFILVGDKMSNGTVWILFTYFLLGFFTKSFAIFLVVPALFCCTIILGRKGSFPRFKTMAFPLLLGLLIIACYYLLMNIYVDGYLLKVWNSEVKRAMYNIMPWHEQPFDYYLKNLHTRFSPWIYMLPLSLLGVIFSTDQKARIVGVYSFVFVFVYLLTISIPSNKLEWYDAPIYPHLALIVGVGVQPVLSKLWGWRSPIWRTLFLGLFFAYFFYSLISLYRYNQKPLDALEREGYALREYLKSNPGFKRLFVLMAVEHDEHYDQLRFYKKKATSQGKSVENFESFSGLKKGDTAICCQTKFLNSVLSSSNPDSCYLIWK